MAKKYGKINSADLLTLEKSFSRAVGQPLDETEIHYNLDEAKAYAASNAAYVGQKVTVIENDIVTYYVIIDTEGNLLQIYNKDNVDGLVAAEKLRAEQEAQSLRNDLSELIVAEKDRATLEEQTISEMLNKETSKLDILIGDDGEKSARRIANEELAAQLLSGEAEASFKTLQELAAWLEDHPENAAALNQDIQDEIARATKEEQAIRNDFYKSLQYETSLREAQVNGLNFSLKEEVYRSKDTDADLQSSIDKIYVPAFQDNEHSGFLADEINRAKEEERTIRKDFNKALADESARAIFEEQTIAEMLNKETSKLDILIGGDGEKSTREVAEEERLKEEERASGEESRIEGKLDVLIGTDTEKSVKDIIVHYLANTEFIITAQGLSENQTEEE